MKQFRLFYPFIAFVIASEEKVKPSWQQFILNTPIDDLIHLPLTLTKHEIRAIKVKDIASQLRRIQPCNDLHENNQIWAESDDNVPQEPSALMLLSFIQSKPLNTMEMVFMSVDDTIVSCVPSHFLSCLNQSAVFSKFTDPNTSPLKDTYVAIKECCIPSDEYSSSSSAADTKSLIFPSLMKKLMRSIRYTFPHHIVIVQRNDEASSCSKMMSFSMDSRSAKCEKSSENCENISVETLLSSPPSSSTISSPHEAIPETEVVGTKREVIVYFLALNPPDKPHLYNGENVRLRSSDIGSVPVVTDS